MIKEIGYANISFNKSEIYEFLKELDGAIIDIRLKPFGLISLRDLRDLDNYYWFKSFGNPFFRDESNPYTEDKFMKYLEENITNSDIDKIKEILKKHKRVYIMCACKDYNKCHRKVVIEFLKLVL